MNSFSEKVNESIQSYKVVMLGSSRAGKTVLLASMYQKLSIPNEDTRFSISCDNPEQGSLLNQKYVQIIDPLREWPKGTTRADVSTWQFTCNVQTRDLTIYPALKFTYIDYAGEILTGPRQGEPSTKSVLEAIKQADTLLVMLDGYKILRLMEGERDDYFVHAELQMLLQIVSQSRQPVHFVLTKWDLFDGKFSLDEIRNHLWEIEAFRQTLLNRRERYDTTRLIPVSAVGTGFAKPEPQPDGTISMHKIKDAKARPFQVEVPLACVLPDVLDDQLRRIANVEGLYDRELGKVNRIVIGLKALHLLVPFLGIVALRGLLNDKGDKKGHKIKPRSWWVELLASGALELLIEQATTLLRVSKETAEDRLNTLQRKKEESIQSVHNQRTAIGHANNSFLYLREKLEEAFPASDLSSIPPSDSSYS
jgi:hypothetical protein